jgi:hypothetical protein
MAKIVVELDVYVVPDDHKVYKCFPGKTYRFYRAVRDSKAVFLDIRGLEVLPDDPKSWKDEEVLKIISDDRWQRELDSRARGNKPRGSEGVGQTDKRTLTFLKYLLLDAKKGDLIVVPADGYTKDVLIGELTTDAGASSKFNAKDGEHEGAYVGRPVKWKSATEKRFLSKALIDLLHSQSAFFALPVPLHEEVYKLAYKNFVYRGNYVSTFQTSKEKFTSEDTAVVSTWFNGFEVLRNAIQQGNVDSLRNLSFFELGLLPLADQVSAELTININSPGSFSIKSGTAFALALMAMLPLAACAPEEIEKEGVIVELQSIGSAKANDCSLQIEGAVKAYVGALGYERLSQSCKLAKRAEKDAKLSTKARLKPKQSVNN